MLSSLQRPRGGFFRPAPPAQVNEQSDISNTQKWDSLRQIMLMSELETHYGLELSDRAMLESTSVAKIRALLSGRAAG